MLPKVEKNKKKYDPDLEQPGLFDKENEKERIVKKRKVVYIAMILTIGLSLSFWIYRSLKNFNFYFKLPSFTFTISKPKNNNIVLPKDDAIWSILLKRIDTNSIIYQNNENIIVDEEKLNNTNFIKNSPYSFSLPEGFKIKEYFEEKENSFYYFSKIITPKQELLLSLKIINSKDLIESKKLIPDLIDQLYWYSLQK